MGTVRLRAGGCGSRQERRRVRHVCVHRLFADGFTPPLAGFAQPAKLGLPLGHLPRPQQAVSGCLQPAHGSEPRQLADPRSLSDTVAGPPAVFPKKPEMGMCALRVEQKEKGGDGGAGVEGRG